jgi:hypothetical protein
MILKTRTLRAVDQKYLVRFEKWCWIRLEKISEANGMKNEEVLSTVKKAKKKKDPTDNKKERILTRLVTFCIGTAF